MYGKIFASIYEGTLYGHWEAIVTMQQLIVLADADGMVDMTPQAMAARTSIPFEIIDKGLKILGEPDPYSRTPGEEGKRIELIDAHRPWGWHLINHAKYKHLQDSDTVRAQNRERAQRFRDKRNASSRRVTDGNGKSRHTDTDTDIHKPKELTSSDQEPSLSASEVVERIPLNDKSEWLVSKSYLTELENCYPAVDGPATLKEIRAWCISNPQKRKTKRGIMRFINRWFERTQNA